ncbi:LuxR C-terminal-related transcriptional regulator [Gordonia sp. NPDC062954]|jgi:DNA-binding CsgD family transcriptional regulator|uniref:LuxR C-terminal-related transcriptional regulator n=1 Tax=Gordonia sp. NPDC062954 TaxID=3364003 RepID=UPI0037CAEB29
MTLAGELERARPEFEAGDWSTALRRWMDIDPAELRPDDLGRLGVAAYLGGHDQTALDALHHAFAAELDNANVPAAVRCAFWMAMIATMAGDPVVGQGWTARANRLLADHDADVVERGYIEIVRMYAHIDAARWPQAFDCARAVAETGHRHHDPDLVAVGIASQGRLTLEGGRVPEGLALFDEAMTRVAAGEVSAVFAGQVYCTMIEGCQRVLDVGRAATWTAALTRWCDRQPGLVPFTGQCAVHRGQMCTLSGAFRDAIAEFDAALARYLDTSASAAGLAFAERGEVYRILGDLDNAELSFSQAGAHGYDPQPALARLWLARGRAQAAAGAAQRLLLESTEPVLRARILPGAVEILLATGAVAQSRPLAAELAEIGDRFGCVALQAKAAFASGTVELADDDPAGALPYLRKARQQWMELHCPYEAARCQAAIGRGLLALSDSDSARAELAAAGRIFDALGARPDAEAVADLLGPDAHPAGLSDREVEVLRLVATGRSNGQVAETLTLSEKTVSRHLSNIFAKLDVNTRTAATAYAYEHGLM